ncbi:hypothetical protein [Rothia sp. L_38]|uniref:hypothetical protein n=1 Tax=Rothia sp. L_38 TaxID=3422315 RepID=UPI003D6A0A14
MNFFYEFISWFGVFIIYGLMFLASVIVVRRVVIKEKPKAGNSKNKSAASKGDISSGNKSTLGDALAQPMELYGSSFAPGRSVRLEVPRKTAARAHQSMILAKTLLSQKNNLKESSLFKLKGHSSVSRETEPGWYAQSSLTFN